MKDFSRVSEQLSEVIPSFQLSEEVREFIQEAKESESLSEEEFEKRYGEEFEVCKVLGSNGWVVSGHSNPRYIKNWQAHNIYLKEVLDNLHILLYHAFQGTQQPPVHFQHVLAYAHEVIQDRDLI